MPSYAERTMYKVNEELTKADEVFPARALNLMPKLSEIPKYEGRRELEHLASTWFSKGLKDVAFHAKEGVPGAAALRQLKCIMGSFEPKHEHKIAAVAFLINEWFDVVPKEKKKEEEGK